MAKLKAVVAKIEDVEEKARDYYTKGADDRFYLDAEGVDDLPVVVGLKRNRDELKSEKLRVEQQRSTDIAALETKIAALEKGNGGGKNDEKIAELENRIKQLTTTSAAEIAARDSQLAKGADAQRRYIRNAEITKALAKQRGNPKFLAHLIEGQVKVDLDGENYRVQVVDASGNPRIKNSMNEAVSIDDLVSEMKANKEYAGAFDATGGSGSGAVGSGGGSTETSGAVRAGSKEYFANLEKVASGAVAVLPAE